MVENEYEKAARTLKKSTIPTHGKWERKEEINEDGVSVYYFPKWDVTAGDYEEDADRYRISSDVNGFIVELSYESDGLALWNVTLSVPTSLGSTEVQQDESVYGADLQYAIDHTETLLSSIPQR